MKHATRLALHALETRGDSPLGGAIDGPNGALAGALFQPWAITESGLQVVVAIASRGALEPQALAARQGAALDNTRDATVRDGVATIPVRGTLTRYAGFFSRISGATSYGALAIDVQTALDTPAVRALLLTIDSPGGEVNGVAELAALIAAARGRKPIVAYVSGEGASAAYYLASAADEIVIAETAIVGGLGVRMSHLDTRAVDAGSGIVEHEWVSSETPLKALDPTSDDGRPRVQTLVDALATVLLDDVATYRGVARRGMAERLGAGEVFVGRAAVARGLADRVGSYEQVHAELAAGRPGMRRPRPAAPAARAAAGSGRTTSPPAHAAPAPGVRVPDPAPRAVAPPPTPPKPRPPVPPAAPTAADIAARVLGTYGRLNPGRVREPSGDGTGDG